MESLTRRGFGLAGMGALASAGTARPARASWLGNLLPGGRGMTESGGVRLKQIASIDLRGQGNEFSWFVSTMAWSPDGSRLVAVNGLGNFLNVIDTATWRLLVRFRIMSSDERRCFGFSAEGRELIASKRVDPGINENPPAFSVFETDTGRVVRESQLLPVSIPELHGKPDDMTLQQRRTDQKLAVSPDGRYVFIDFRGGTSRTTRWFNYVFNATSGQLIATGDARPFSLPSINNNNLLAGIVTFSAQGLSPASREITIYRLPTLSKVLSFPAPVQGIASLAWSPAGDRLAGGANGLTHPREEESIRVWDAASGARLAVFIGKFEPVVYLKWHPSGKFFVTSSAKGTGEQGALVQFLPAHGGEPIFRHFAPDRVVITGPCFCARTGLFAWHERGRILIHEIQGL